METESEEGPADSIELRVVLQSESIQSPGTNAGGRAAVRADERHHDELGERADARVGAGGGAGGQDGEQQLRCGGELSQQLRADLESAGAERSPRKDGDRRQLYGNEGNAPGYSGGAESGAARLGADFRAAIADRQRGTIPIRRSGGEFDLPGRAVAADAAILEGRVVESVLHVFEIDRRSGAGAEFLRPGGGAGAVDERSPAGGDGELGAGVAGGRDARIPVASGLAGERAEGLDAFGQPDGADGRAADADGDGKHQWNGLGRSAARRCNGSAVIRGHGIFQYGGVRDSGGGDVRRRRAGHHRRAGI